MTRISPGTVLVLMALSQLCASLGAGEEASTIPTARGDRWHADYLRGRTEAIEAACLKDIDTLEKWDERAQASIARSCSTCWGCRRGLRKPI